MRTYSEVSKLESFDDRLKYLLLHGKVSDETFGIERYLNQEFYHSEEWRQVRNFVIARDGGYDLGVEGCHILGSLIIHHMNPITIDDIEKHSSIILDPDNLICVSDATHRTIHYGAKSKYEYVERSPNDTSPWRL